MLYGIKIHIDCQIQLCTFSNKGIWFTIIIIISLCNVVLCLLFSCHYTAVRQSVCFASHCPQKGTKSKNNQEIGEICSGKEQPVLPSAISAEMIYTTREKNPKTEAWMVSLTSSSPIAWVSYCSLLWTATFNFPLPRPLGCSLLSPSSERLLEPLSDSLCPFPPHYGGKQPEQSHLAHPAATLCLLNPFRKLHVDSESSVFHYYTSISLNSTIAACSTFIILLLCFFLWIKLLNYAVCADWTARWNMLHMNSDCLLFL